MNALKAYMNLLLHNFSALLLRYTFILLHILIRRSLFIYSFFRPTAKK